MLLTKYKNENSSANISQKSYVWQISPYQFYNTQIRRRKQFTYPEQLYIGSRFRATTFICSWSMSACFLASTFSAASFQSSFASQCFICVVICGSWMQPRCELTYDSQSYQSYQLPFWSRLWLFVVLCFYVKVAYNYVSMKVAYNCFSMKRHTIIFYALSIQLCPSPVV